MIYKCVNTKKQVNLMIEDNNVLNQYKEAKRIIRRAMDEHQLVIFVGAGASIASGMPSWGQAIKIIADKLFLKDDQLDYLRIPQYYFNSRGKKEYTQLMHNIFRHGDYLLKHKIHDKIMEFNVSTIITTNYDHLIEQAAEDNSQILYVVSKDSDLPYRRGGKELIKMHGDFENDNFVLKEDDYLSYSRNFKLIENYVKALIGTKVVLFIGYSFSDPDLKLIFSWVKDILGGDFQRAYLIESGKSYDVNEAEYFKNFGINLLYSSIQLQSQYSADNLTNNLFLMLEWLLVSDENDKLTMLYNELKPFISMKYASKKYVETALAKAGILSGNGRISLPFIEDKEDTSFIFKALAYEQWVKFDKKIILSNDLLEQGYREEENNKRVAEYLKDFKPEKTKHEKIRQILSVLCKSNLQYIQIHFSTEKYLLAERKGAIIPLKRTCSPEWMNYVDTFDFAALERIAENNYFHITNNEPDLFMEQGYIQFILGNYLSAYHCYKSAKSIYYKRQEYIKFFVAEFSRYILGEMITNPNGVFYEISKDMELVEGELKTIDLDKLFNTLPDLGKSNNVLKDMYTFNVAYTLFQQAYKSSEKVQEEANTSYLMFSGTTAFKSMHEDMLDYYKYISLNMLPVNNYMEHVNIFHIYFDSIVNSVMSTIDVSYIGNNNTVTNVHANQLEQFDVMISLKFIKVNELERLLNRFSNILRLSSEALKYLETVIKNCNKKKIANNFPDDDIFLKCIVILRHCNLSVSLVETVFYKLNELITLINRRQYVNNVIGFIKNSDKQKFLFGVEINLVSEFLQI